uniref:Uncharacterized protein n=1 Tax=viral metagenome TaxID=1070528 RepID=A0A6M3M5Y0_9ZZZZ
MWQQPSLRRLRGTTQQKLLSRRHFKCRCTEGTVEVHIGTDLDGRRTEVRCNKCDRLLHTLTVLPLIHGDLGV